jgi:hypothetical protein
MGSLPPSRAVEEVPRACSVIGGAGFRLDSISAARDDPVTRRRSCGYEFSNARNVSKNLHLVGNSSGPRSPSNVA